MGRIEEILNPLLTKVYGEKVANERMAKHAMEQIAWQVWLKMDKDWHHNDSIDFDEEDSKECFKEWLEEKNMSRLEKTYKKVSDAQPTIILPNGTDRIRVDYEFALKAMALEFFLKGLRFFTPDNPLNEQGVKMFTEIFENIWNADVQPSENPDFKGFNYTGLQG